MQAQDSLQAAVAAAQTALQSGQVAEAEAACRHALALAPAEAQLHLLLGDILQTGGRFDEAEAAYVRSTELFPGLGLPFTRLATLRLRQRFPLAAAPRVADPARPCLQMSGLGQRGRFGNQLLQYGFARLYADRHGLELKVPDWLGRDLYGHDDPLPDRPLPALDESQADFGALLRGAVPGSLAGHDISGYFCWNTGAWGDCAEAFRALFTLVPSIGRQLDAAFERLSAGSGTRVAIHLRRGDFGQGRFWVAPVAWYRDWLEAIWPTLDRPCLYIATDAPQLAAEFAAYRPILASDVSVDLPGAEFIVDHYWLSRAEHLAISNSSFSFSAAMLNARLAGAVRPDPAARQLKPFDPWRAPVLIDAPRRPDAVSAAERFLMSSVLTRATVAVHVGPICSAWTTEVRAQLPRLKVYEIDAATGLDAFRQTQPLRHIDYLRLDSARELGAVLGGAVDSLRHARIDTIEFTTHGDGIGRDVARLVAAGYRLLGIERQGLRPLAEGRIRQPGTYVLIHERLLVPKPTPGEPLIDIGAAAARLGVALTGRGVLHVGAHEGQETATYQRLGLKPIVMIEANPAVFERLTRNVGAVPDVYTVQRAVSDRSGTLKLHLASFDQSSSLLPMAGHREVYPNIRPAGEIEVQASPLDVILDELGLPPAQFALLHIDVQGAEMQVLRGAEAVLAAVDLVSVEINFAELYRGCAQIEDIEAWLGERGFQRVAISSAYHPSWGDALYRRMPRAAA